MVRRAIRYVADAVRRPREELTRRQRQVRFSWELVSHCWRVLQRHRAQGMAAELTYRTIFALIPLAVLGLVMFNIVGGMDEVRERVEGQLYAFFGVPDIAYEVREQPLGIDVVPDNVIPIDPAGVPDEQAAAIPAALPDAVSADPPAALAEPLPAGDAVIVSPDGVTTAADPTTAEPTPAEKERMAEASIRRALSDSVDKVAQLDFASIGLIGLLLFIYAAFGLTDSVEDVFNTIFEAPDSRPIHMRFAIHWAIITLGSGLLAVSLYLSSQFVAYVADATLGADSGVYLNHVAAVLASWVLLFLLYALMPNARVSVRAAMVGALIAALLWETAKFGFQVYVRTALPYSALYGSLGLIPLFLFWVYITWWIFLFGLVWTYTLQTVRGRVPTKEEDEAAVVASGDPDWMLPVMVEVGRAFQTGRQLTRSKLVERLGLPGRSIHDLCDALVEEGLLRRGDGEAEACLLPARPLEQITVEDVLSLKPYGHQPSTEQPAWRFLQELDEHRRQLAQQTTLAELAADAPELP
ncbi:YhjD/YihY/BrkB family envelope integrity protein [Roseimaritima ulvae]|uniref:Uncharacterized protein n=1 Tax=Roseimaritima ulvae TaxID=980254 RepID=A0A5B9QWS6_9BACT|nr:YhjD/YihY/BrkB family envelope integrity protein [Roseimaritima ulvae]QEG43498.1 ribonuclease BN/unknown domain fusion protein [Roseimaritima ulvae]